MPCGKYFSFSVQIAERNLEELEFESKNYVCVNLHGSQSYVVEEADDEDGCKEQQFQKYPVTPFKVQVDKQYQYPCWFTMYMDGERVSSFPIQNQGKSTRIKDGYKSGNEIRELAFSLPRISNARTLTKTRQDKAGTLQIVCQEAIPLNIAETVPVPTSRSTNTLPQTTDYPQLTKRDASTVQGGLGVVCREGRTFRELDYDHCTYRKRLKLVRGKTLEELTVHYRSKEVLQDLGISFPTDEDEVVDKLNKVDINGSSADPETNKGLPDLIPTMEMKRELIELENRKSTVNVRSAENVAQLKTVDTEESSNGKQGRGDEGRQNLEYLSMKSEVPPSPVAIKHEQIKMEAEMANLIELKSELLEGSDDDDDVVYVETTYMKREPGDMDDSVIYMGDDSCCEIELPPEEISVMDLCDED